jgi:hypothetical protein
MDKIINIALGLLTVILIVFISLIAYQGFVESAYLNSLSSTYSYTCTITTDSALTNVTLFIPVPADPLGNSPIVTRFSAHAIAGLPDDWTVTLYDTGKATVVKITTPAITPPGGTSPAKPFTLTLSSEMKSNKLIDTREPINNSALFHPVKELQLVACPPGSSPVQETPQCYRYVTSLYADYEAAPGASVNITSTIVGRNSWNIFEPGSNEYTTMTSLLMSGSHKGWATMKGRLTSGIGTYTTPLSQPGIFLISPLINNAGIQF